MLHITWLLIKFILITLGVLLGLLLVCVLLILFCPVRYRVRAVKSGPEWKKVSGTAGVSWLFEGIRFQVLLEDGRFRFGLRLLGISLDRFLNKEPGSGEASGEETPKKAQSRAGKETPKRISSDAPQVTENKPQEETAERDGGFSKDGTQESFGEKGKNISAEEKKNLSKKEEEKSSGEGTQEISKGNRKARGKTSSADQKKKDSDVKKNKAVPEKDSAKKGKKPAKSVSKNGKKSGKSVPKTEQKQPGSEKASPMKAGTGAEAKKSVPEAPPGDKTEQKAVRENKIRSVWEKLKNIPEKIRTAFRNLSEKIRAIRSKIDWWKEFLTHPKTVEAISSVKKWLLRLLKHIFPTKIGGKITFGSENPAVTGAVLSVMGATIPLHKNSVELYPLFEGNNVLQGEIWLKGRVYGIVLLVTALQVFFDKNIRFVISRWKHRAG